MAKSSELQAAGRSQSASALHPAGAQASVGTRYEVSFKNNIGTGRRWGENRIQDALDENQSIILVKFFKC